MSTEFKNDEEVNLIKLEKPANEDSPNPAQTIITVSKKEAEMIMKDPLVAKTHRYAEQADAGKAKTK